ncbi:MAG TPA: hypothetical protein VKD47_03365 [Miltoncostaeaceae bacterium]|nr:hypothetical protein [Miltoncostaeaceae bacterium]
MAIPNDPITRRTAPARTVAPQAPDLCSWCLGGGSILEPLDGDRPHEYLPVVCPGCRGTGRVSR